MRFVAAIAAVLLATSLLASSCGGDSTDSSDAIEFTVKTTDLLTYEPSELRVRAGEPVVIHLDNSSGSGTHDLSIVDIEVENVRVDEPKNLPGHMDMPDLDLHVMLGATQTAMIRFTPTEPGTYEFFCTSAGHREAGMTGRLVVE